MTIQEIRKLRNKSLNAYRQWREMKNENMARHIKCSVWQARELSRGVVPNGITAEQLKMADKWMAKRDKLWKDHLDGSLRAIGDKIGCCKEKVAKMLNEKNPSRPLAPVDSTPECVAEFMAMRLPCSSAGMTGYY